MNIPPGYRRLERGETILATDLYQENGLSDKLVSEISYVRGWIGKAHGEQIALTYCGDSWQILRRISPWVAISEAMPKSEDCNERGHVIWRASNGQIREGQSGSFNYDNATHWMKIPELPTPIAPPIYITEGISKREIIFNKDGSIKAGCADISASQMDAIVKRWEEVKK